MSPRNQTLIFFLSLLLFQVSCQEDIENDSGHLPKVYVDKSEDGFALMRDGKPFFIKGACGNQFLKSLKAAGANTVRPYDTTNLKQLLDSAEHLDLAVVIDIPVPRYEEPDTIFSDRAKMDRLFGDTRKFVRTYKDHPAILYWMLGNEINYPDWPGDGKMTKNFNTLIDIVHEEDPEHPVSTAIGGFQRSTILSIQLSSDALDLISINIFGELGSFQNRKNNMELLWNGPYVLSELGVNGPWEAENTSWEVPIEESSTKKAEHFRERYRNYIATLDDGRFLGSLFFYWGNKQERTHTWFSTLNENGKKTQNAYEFENFWKGKNRSFEGPEINYALLNDKGAQESIVLKPGEKAMASLLLSKRNVKDLYDIQWNVRPENWNYDFDAIEEKPDVIKGLVNNQNDTVVEFLTPQKEGPYRLFVTVADKMGYIATTNVPFYILNPAND